MSLALSRQAETTMHTANSMASAPCSGSTSDALRLRETWASIMRFIEWLDTYGEESHDFQSYYASKPGRRAKRLYYKRPLFGTFAVLPMVVSEAFAPSARRLFWKPQRFPIADAHFAMGFAFLAELFGEERYYKRALHFLEVLQQTRCPGHDEYCWGYPFHWETLFGTIPFETPLITTVPYVFEAFQQVYRIDGDQKWRQIMHSIARHAFREYKDLKTSERAASCSYTTLPHDASLCINSNAYRAYLLTNAAIEFSDSSYESTAERNLNFVLEAQNPDGSWFYAVDGKRSFIDHFHTCFVLKALTKIETLTGNSACTMAIERGIHYYTHHLFDEGGIPRPFSQAPRLVVYRRELYDYAESINLALLLRGRFPKLDHYLITVVNDIIDRWQTPEGSYRSRELRFGWDNTPMHRWAASQLFRSLSFLLHTQAAAGSIRISEEA